MNSVTIGVFAASPEERAAACRELAKKSSEDDLAFYHTVYQGKLVCALEPARYPEKIQAALFAAYLSDYCILLASEPGPQLGELIVLLDSLRKRNGAIVSTDPSRLAPLIKGTCLEAWNAAATIAEARQLAYSAQAECADGATKGVVDHAFEVRGVGSVALGVLKRGSIKVHDELYAYPQGKALQVRSIQENDVDVQQASCGDRFGISFKGLAAADLERGNILSTENGVKTLSEAECEVSVSKYHRKGLAAGEALHACIGLQMIPCKVSSAINAGGKARSKVSFEKNVAVDESDVIVLVDLNAGALRVAGTATLA